MSIVSVKYRFLRLNSTTLALVEIYPFSSSFPSKPEVCQQLYPYFPYLSKERFEILTSIYSPEELKDWIKEQENDFRLSISEACNYPDIDFGDYHKEVRERILWNYLDPLEEVKWDEYCPLFDNDYKFILRD
jgi:hypothetical protein